MRVPEVVRRVGGWMCLAALGSAAPAAAQLRPVVYGAAERGTEDVSLYLLGASAAPPWAGWQPVVGAHAYRLTFPTGTGEDGTAEIQAVNPYAGIRHLWPFGAVQLTAGYLVTDDTEAVDGGFGGPGGAEPGVTTAFQANYWGITGVRTGQAIASYNWGAEYFWGQLRVLLQQLASPGRGSLRPGAEVVGQRGGPGDHYAAFQFGPVVELSLSSGFRLAGSVGARSDNRPQPETFFPYFKLDFVVVP
jgi:hypothetical protein